MPNSFVSHLYCPKCASRYNIEDKHQLCLCGSPLLVAYDMERLAGSLTPAMLREREPSLWRYRELLPVIHPEHIVTLGEGFTPLLPMPSIGADMQIPGLLMKDEGLLPTGSFKARGAAVGISKAKELGVQELAMPTNGNAGAAWSLYAARAKMKSTVIMPVDAPLITRNECAISGSNLYLVDGLISDAGRIVADLVKAYGLYDASTLKEPYRIEGKKTMGLEIAEQLDWKLPDVILYPTGGGVGLIGIYKALKELQTLGWVQGKLPRLVAVQAEGCAPIVKAWEDQEKESQFWAESKTVAFGINVPKALGDFLVLEALYATGGCAVSIQDEELLQEQQRVAELEGAFVCPEGAATFAAARKLKQSGWIGDDEIVIALNTGAGIKYPDTVTVQVPVLQPGERITR